MPHTGIHNHFLHAFRSHVQCLYELLTACPWDDGVLSTREDEDFLTEEGVRPVGCCVCGLCGVMPFDEGEEVVGYVRRRKGHAALFGAAADELDVVRASYIDVNDREWGCRIYSPMIGMPMLILGSAPMNRA